MPIKSMRPVLKKAYSKGYAVGAFNIFNLNFLEAICDAAAKQRSPVILNIAEAHFQYVKPEHILPAVRAIAESSPIDFVVNLDHGLTMDGIKRALDNGFTNIMFDGSHLNLQENIKQTKKVVQICKRYNVSVEAELGAVGGAEGGVLYANVDPSKYTDIDQAKVFVEETEVDFLAIAFGNSHGKYKGRPDLDFVLLEALKNATKIPLVLHGGSGISPQDFRKSISLGISKINYFTGMAQKALEITKTYMASSGEVYDDYPLMIQSVRLGVSKLVAAQMDIFGSTGQCG